MDRFAVDRVFGDSTWELHLARRRSDGRPVLIRSLARPDADARRIRAWLAHELLVRERLDPAWAVMPLDSILCDDGRLRLVLEHAGGVPLSAVSAPLDTERLLELALEVTRAVEAQHRAGILHGCLTPLHVLRREDGGVRLTGFFLSRSLGDDGSVGPRDILDVDAALPYMAPECTGMVRALPDPRSDLYSLGVILYQLATGRLPFNGADALEWAHCHVATEPKPPHEIEPTLPAPLGGILLKLLGKAPEHRYQNGAGLHGDLEHCLNAWRRERRIKLFPLGRTDTLGSLTSPRRLYGRESDLAALKRTFARVATTGTLELVLVSGGSGVGKTALVRELPRAFGDHRASFLGGKFDQVPVEIPYATLVQAFTEATRHLLGSGAKELSFWRARILAALGVNGRLLTAVIPQLELIVGPQPPVPELPPAEAKHRFSSVLSNLVAAFADADRPLVLFLDDLQWADTASLEFLRGLLTRKAAHHVMVIGALRDEALAPDHPVATLLASLEEAGITPERLVLQPLTLDDLSLLVADALNVDVARGAKLGELLVPKTGGNCFHLLQLLRSLHSEGHLRFSYGSGRWEWDADAIRVLPSSDDMLGLMLRRIASLPAATRLALVGLACVGAQADAALLAEVCACSSETLARDIAPALDDGLIVEAPRGYRFVHDRVQQAALNAVPETERPGIHLAVARVLDARGTDTAEGIFTTVSQYRLGAALLTNREEQRHVAALTLRAGRAAKASAAYQVALDYLQQGLEALPDADTDRALAFQLAQERAECTWLVGSPMVAKDLFEALLTWPTLDQQETATLLCRLIEVSTTLGEMQDAIRYCQRCLALLALDLPAHPTPEQIESAYADLWSALGERPIASLVDLPELTDPVLRTAMAAMAATIPAAVFASESVPHVLLCRMGALSIRHGNSAPGAAGYSYLAMLLTASDDHRSEGYELGRLAVDLVERRGYVGYKPRIYVMFGNVVNVWWRPMSTCLAYVRDAFAAARMVGDLTGACYCCNHLVTTLLAMGHPLSEVDQACEEGLSFVRQASYGDVADIILSHQRLVHDMQGRTRSGAALSELDERVARSQMTLLRFWHGTISLQTHVLSGAFAQAVEIGRRMETLLWSSPSDIHIFEYHFYFGIALAADTQALSAEERASRVALLERIVAMFEAWGERCPETFLHKRHLLAAELARFEGRAAEAGACFAQAIQSSSDAGFVHITALTCERAASFYQALGQPVVADAFLRQAALCYAAWGAERKVRELVGARGEIIGARHALAAGSDSVHARHGATDVRLDRMAAIKASQAISEEILLNRLLHRLLSIALESTGAQRCVLVLLDDDRVEIAAEAYVASEGGIETDLSRDMATLGEVLPEIVMNYVRRTREPLVIDDAATPGAFSEAFRGRNERSVLCLPVIRAGRVLGLMYFAHGGLTSLFTADRLAFLELLSGQFAISVENARLYQRLLEENERRTAAEERLALATSSAKLGIWDWDIVGDRLHWDDQMFRMYGIVEPVHFGVSFWEDRLHPGDRAPAVAAVRASLAAGKPLDTSFRICLPDGSVRHINCCGLVICDDSGNPRRMLGINQDITDRVNLEQRLAQAEKLLSLGQLAGGIAHNFNNQLAGILGCTELLLASELSDCQREYAKSIVASSRRAADLTAQLLAFARKGSTPSSPTDVHELIRETVRLLQQGVGPGMDVELHLDAGQPFVLGDPSQLQNMLLNLGINARDAMPKGGRLVITTCSEDLSEATAVSMGVVPGPYLRISVADTGEGMTPEIRKHLFEPFFTTKPVGKGTGLGLASVHGTVGNHRGAISVESEPNAGTTFTIHLPLLATPPARAVARSGSKVRVAHGRRRRVLLVDDEEAILDVSAAMLRHLGYEVDAFQDGKVAIAHFREAWARIDLVILDLQMPQLGGREVFAALRAVDPRVRALVASGFSVEDEAREIVNDGAKGFLQKPFTLAQLAKAVATVLEEEKMGLSS